MVLRVPMSEEVNSEFKAVKYQTSMFDFLDICVVAETQAAEVIP
jgi:hypothetical protein